MEKIIREHPAIEDVVVVGIPHPYKKQVPIANIVLKDNYNESAELTDDIKKLLSLTDLVLLDIKHIDPKKCKDLVGFSNERELAFAQYLSDNGISMWIRQVLIPGYTNAPEDLQRLKNFISSLKTVKKIELLPYHDMGSYKWKELGLKYGLKNVSPATDDDIKQAKKILGI